MNKLFDTIEEWRLVESASKTCYASKYGEIIGSRGKILAQTSYSGYYTCSAKYLPSICVHIVIARTFPEICGEWFEGCTVDHIDGNPLNNRADNLRICSQKENNHNPVSVKRFKEKKPKHCRPVVQYDKNWNYIDDFDSPQSAAVSIGENREKGGAYIRKAAAGKTTIPYSAFGYFWKTKEEPDLEGEIWRESTYIGRGIKVSNKNRVKSKTGLILKVPPMKTGYRSMRGKLLHIAVAIAFPEICGVYYKGCVIDHLNGLKSDNTAENLRVRSFSENMKNPVTVKKIEKLTLLVRRFKIIACPSVSAAAKKMRVSKYQIGRACKKRIKTGRFVAKKEDRFRVHIFKYKDLV